jgi:hypothetical protein
MELSRSSAIYALKKLRKAKQMRSILLWAIGVPIPIIILIWLLF